MEGNVEGANHIDLDDTTSEEPSSSEETTEEESSTLTEHTSSEQCDTSEEICETSEDSWVDDEKKKDMTCGPSTDDEDGASDCSDNSTEIDCTDADSVSGLCISMTEMFGASRKMQELCQNGLMLMEQLYASGNREPALMIRDVLKGLDGQQCVIATVTAKVMSLNNALNLLLDVYVEWNDEEMNSPLHLAVIRNNVDLVKVLMKIEKAKRKKNKNKSRSGLEFINKVNGDGMTPLMIAASEGHLKCLQLLLKAGADINFSCIDGETPLHHSAKGGHMECLRLLLKCKGVKVNKVKENGYTPLLMAVEHNHLECVQLLLEAGVNVKVKGRGVLHKAALANNVAIMRVLIDAGASREDVQDTLKPIHIAASVHALDCLKMLLDFGAKVNTKSRHGTTALHLAVEAGCLREDRFRQVFFENTEDCYAIIRGTFRPKQTECVKMLLKAGADVGARGRHLETPVHWCAQEGPRSCLTLLLSAGADANSKSSREETPLHFAAKGRNPETMRLLLEAGADVNHADHKGRTAMHVVAEFPKPECMRLLIDAGADVNAESQKSETPLKRLIRKASILLYITKDDRKDLEQCVNILVEVTADVSTVNLSFLKSHLSAIRDRPPMMWRRV